MICFSPTATHWQTCPVLIAAVAFAGRKIGFFLTAFKDGNRTGNCGWGNRYWLLGTERTQTPNTKCGGSVRTRNDDRKRPDFFIEAFVKERCAKKKRKYVRKFNLTQKDAKCHFEPENL